MRNDEKESTHEKKGARYGLEDGKGDIPLFCCFDRLGTTIGSDW